MKNKGKIFNWIFSVFCILCLPAYGFHIGSILMCILGIASLPIEPIKEKWDDLLPYKKLRPIILGILFVVFVFILPTDSAEPSNNEITQEVTIENTIETEQIKQVETEEPGGIVEKVETTQVETESEETSETEITIEEIEATQVKTEIEEISETKDATEEITEVAEETITQTQPSTEVTISVADIPAYSGNPYVAINNNVPQFLKTDLSTTSYEYYSKLDSLGRCGVVYACIGTDLMPTEERGNIGSVKPTGWQTVKYDNVDGKYLYNRCHLIGYQLSGENANTQNLITGTRYMNVDGMLPFENMVADYVQETGNHVLYRVTPIFEGNNLLASGVQIEAQSVEDNGDGILFNVFCYNVQPGIIIDYATGNSSAEADATVKVEPTPKPTPTPEPEPEPTPAPTPEPEPTPEPTPDTGSATLVWKSETGSKYHSINNCGRMNPNKATQITESEAISQGLGKCSKCW